MPFSECSGRKSHIKIDGRHDKVNSAILRKNGVLPLNKACHSKMATTPLSSFITSFGGVLQEEYALSRVRTRDGFDLNVYKLIKKSCYDFSKASSFGNVVEARPYGLNVT